MPSDMAPTRRSLIAEATAALSSAGVAEPRREALRLWSELRGGSPVEVLLDGEAEADVATASALRQVVGRRVAGEPLAHVTGRIGFRTLDLMSDRRALIPRPETEGLVDLVLARVRTGRLADIGTGSGCLALSLAAEGGFSQVSGLDVSAAALALATANRDALGARVDLMRGDLCQPLRADSFDAVVSNPPYLTEAE